MTYTPAPKGDKPRRSQKGHNRLGSLIKEIREKRRKFTRSAVIARYQAALAHIDRNYDYSEVINEAWLARVERNDINNVDQRTLHLLCRALECTQIEQMEVMVAAGRNVMANHNGEMTEGMLVIQFMAMSLYSDPMIRKLATEMMRDRRFFELSESDRHSIMVEVLKVAKLPEADSIVSTTNIGIDGNSAKTTPPSIAAPQQGTVDTSPKETTPSAGETLKEDTV
jgi:hypothetical protein